MGNKSMVSYKVEKAVAVLTIDNSPVNALSKRVILEVKDSLEKLMKDRAVRAVVITGRGSKAFVGGVDIKELPSVLEGSREAAADYADNGHSMFNAVAEFSKPTIAAVNGFALGGGLELALCCDFRIAGSNASFGLPEINLGIMPSGGGTQRLPRLIGEARAKELIFLGEPIDAKIALEFGLVNRVVPPEDVLTESVSLAQKIATRPGAAIRFIKQCMEAGIQMPIKDSLKLEIDYFGELFLTHDAKAGITAFIEKNKPQFKHC